MVPERFIYPEEQIPVKVFWYISMFFPPFSSKGGTCNFRDFLFAFVCHQEQILSFPS